MVKLYLTDSYYNLFPTLIDLIEKDALNPDLHNLVFCEAKISLMIERLLCARIKGSMNTDVYSFGNFLRANKTMSNVLSKEGASMALKKVLSKTALKCFKSGNIGLSSSLYDLIIQLKSAKVTPEDVKNSSQSVKGILKNKLIDIANVYGEYERFVTENGYDDQSSQLSYLPEVISSSKQIKNSQVYLVGYSGFTAQMRCAIEALIENSKNVTAILTCGENPFMFVNETTDYFKAYCKAKGKELSINVINSDYALEGKIITDNLFSPFKEKRVYSNRKDVNSIENNKKYQSDKIHVYSAVNPFDEILRVGEIIKSAVMSGDMRFRDATIAVNDAQFYKDHIKIVFEMLDIPYFLDDKTVLNNHPLITLILAFNEIKRRGFNRESVLGFVKNPYFICDKNLSDRFENYTLKYNINYSGFTSPFTLKNKDEDITELERIRIRFVDILSVKTVGEMLEKIDAEKMSETLALSLDEINHKEEGALTRQIYPSVINILNEMEMMLGGMSLSESEFKNIFLSGVSALKLSIIPQYNDAVYIGGFKETALVKAKRLFIIGLTDGVPSVSEDIAILSDSDIDVLEEIKVLVEPKIRIINHRNREKTGMAVSAFSDKLYLSYPVSGIDGEPNFKSEILDFIENTFTVKPFPEYDGYLTKDQGYRSFSLSCGEFAEGKTQNDKPYDFTLPSSYCLAVGKEKVTPLLDRANKQITNKLQGERSLIKQVISPTTIENYNLCPYLAFLKHTLKITDRETGETDSLKIGTLMHDIFNMYVDRLEEISDKQTSDKVFNSVIDILLTDGKYSKFLLDPATKSVVERIVKETNKYCYKTYLSLISSEFDNCRTEVAFDDKSFALGRGYPSVSLADGTVKLKGKIDRVDEGRNYFRIIDYKSGNVKEGDKNLFGGTKLQLYLYTQAVMTAEENKKRPAGCYYLPVSDAFSGDEQEEGAKAVGKTLNEQEAIVAQDKNFLSKGVSEYSLIEKDKNNKIKNGVTKEEMDAYVNYAVKVSENAIERMKEGYIKPSPYEGACKYCKFKSMCFYCDGERKIKKIGKDLFVKTLKTGGVE